MLKSRSFFASILFLLTLACIPFAAQAHSDEHLESVGGVHGGMLRMSGPYHLELVVEDGTVTVWVMDHSNAPQSTSGAQGQLLLLQGGERISVDLESQDESALRGSDDRIQASQSPRAVLTLSMSGQPPLQLRFATIAKPSAKNSDHDQHSHGQH